MGLSFGYDMGFWNLDAVGVTRQGRAQIAPGGGARNGDTQGPPPSMTDLVLGGSDPPPLA